MGDTTTSFLRRKDGSTYYEGPEVPIMDALRSGAGGGWKVRDVDLSGMDLSGVSFEGLTLAGCDLSRTRLNPVGSGEPGGDVAFRRCDMRRANLGGADLGRASFQDCDMRGATLAHARAMATPFLGCDLSGVNATSIYAPAALLKNCTMRPYDVERTRFDGASLQDATLAGSRLEDASFENADLHRSDLSKASASKSSFRGANLQGAVFTGGKVRGCDFTGADLRHWKLPIMRRGSAQADRTVGLQASDNTYGWEVPKAVKRRVAAEVRAALAGQTGWAGARDALRRVQESFGEDLIDRTAAPFRRDRMAGLLCGWASIGVGAGIAAVLTWQASQYVEGFAGHGAAVGLIVAAAALAGGPAKGLLKGAAAATALAVKEHAAPLIEQAVRRGGNLADLVVVAWRGESAGGALGRALAAGGALQALSGNVRVAVCDNDGIDKAMALMQAAVASPGSMQEDVILLRGGNAGPGDAPVALRFHAAGGMSAIYPDRADGTAVVRRWEAPAVGTYPTYPDVLPDPDPVREDCAAAREAFYRAILQDQFGQLPADRSVRDVRIGRDPNGRLSAQFGYDGPEIASRDPDLPPCSTVATFGMT